VIRDFLRQVVSEPNAPKRPPAIRPAGRHHNLGAILSEMAHHFPGAKLPLITWGARRKPGRAQVRLGSYNPRQDVIRVNPVLDHPDVPPAMLRFVIYHEMVHHQLEPKRHKTEPMHGARFKSLERACPDFEAAAQWQKHHLSAHLVQARRRSS
jgi:hypothetical protein